MSKPKKSDATPPPPPPPAPTPSQPAPVERPRKGGSYVIGKEGGTPKPAGEEESPAQAETQTAGDDATTDQDQEG